MTVLTFDRAEMPPFPIEVGTPLSRTYKPSSSQMKNPWADKTQGLKRILMMMSRPDDEAGDGAHPTAHPSSMSTGRVGSILEHDHGYTDRATR
jgi:hypothetical protein